MASCSSNCACCQRHTVHIHSLQQRALNELNSYRKILQLDLLTSMDAFEFSIDNANIKPVPYLGSITRPASFELMPPEILDRIVPFVDSNSILPLCHALPYYKYISSAMFDTAHQFPEDYHSLYQLWPNMCFPWLPSAYSKPIKHMDPVIVYAHIIAKHGGNVTVPCSWNVFNYLGALPDVLSISPGDMLLLPSGLAEFLGWLADGKKRIRSCIVEMDSAGDECTSIAQQLARLQIQSLIWYDSSTPVAILDVLPFISGLSYLEVFDPEIMRKSSNILSRCLNLKEIGFSCVGGGNPVSEVDCILKLIKGTHIEKVWIKKESPWETVASYLLEHGWRQQKQNQDDGDFVSERVCFAYRPS